MSYDNRFSVFFISYEDADPMTLDDFKALKCTRVRSGGGWLFTRILELYTFRDNNRVITYIRVQPSRPRRTVIAALEEGRPNLNVSGSRNGVRDNNQTRDFETLRNNIADALTYVHPHVKKDVFGRVNPDYNQRFVDPLVDDASSLPTTMSYHTSSRHSSRNSSPSHDGTVAMNTPVPAHVGLRWGSPNNSPLAADPSDPFDFSRRQWVGGPPNPPALGGNGGGNGGGNNTGNGGDGTGASSGANNIELALAAVRNVRELSPTNPRLARAWTELNSYIAPRLRNMGTIILDTIERIFLNERDN